MPPYHNNQDNLMGEQKKAMLKKLLSLAYSSGASDAKIISPNDISVEEGLANLCNKESCKNYSLSPSCPPHVFGPSGFRKLQKNAAYAMVLKITVPSAILFSEERKEVMRLLHEVTAIIEQAAIKMGATESKAFAGGSCKKIFCHDHANCRALSGDGECRYPQSARASMSGFGINVSELMKTCRWPSDINIENDNLDSESMSWVAGLILIG